MIQPSFCGIRPFLTGNRGGEKDTHVLSFQITSWPERKFLKGNLTLLGKERDECSNSLIFPFSPFCLLDSSSASCFFLFSALAACSFLVLFSC